MSSYDSPIIWLAGGRAKDNDYAELDSLVSDKVKLIITFGEEKEAIYRHYKSITQCVKTADVEQAVMNAHDIASEGDIVLMSPACKSFDQFINYEHRGEVFKNAVMRYFDGTN